MISKIVYTKDIDGNNCLLMQQVTGTPRAPIVVMVEPTALREFYEQLTAEINPPQVPGRKITDAPQA